MEILGGKIEKERLNYHSYYAKQIINYSGQNVDNYIVVSIIIDMISNHIEFKRYLDNNINMYFSEHYSKWIKYNPEYSTLFKRYIYYDINKDTHIFEKMKTIINEKIKFDTIDDRKKFINSILFDANIDPKNFIDKSNEYNIYYDYICNDGEVIVSVEQIIKIINKRKEYSNKFGESWINWMILANNKIPITLDFINMERLDRIILDFCDTPNTSLVINEYEIPEYKRHIRYRFDQLGLTYNVNNKNSKKKSLTICKLVNQQFKKIYDVKVF